MAFCCQLLLLLHPAASRHCCHCLIRGSRGEADMAACCGGSDSSSSGSRDGGWWQRYNPLPGCCRNPPPLCSSSSLASSFPFLSPVAPGSFRRLPLARLQCAMVGCCLLSSTALLVIACHPAIVDDCVGRLPAHLVALVLLAAAPLSLFDPDVVVVVVVVMGGGAGLSAGTKPWQRTSWSSSTSGHRHCLGSVHPSGDYNPPPPPGSRVARPPLRGRHLLRIWMTMTMTSTMAAAASGKVNNGTPLLSLSVDDDNDKDEDRIIEAEQ